MSNQISINERKLQASIAKVQKNLELIKDDAEKAKNRALFDVGLKFFEISEPYIPVITGLLKSSKNIASSNNKVEVSLNTKYAAKVHDRRQYFATPLNSNSDNLQKFYEERFNAYFF